MSEPMLKIDVDGTIATLTMNQPDKRKAMCEALLGDLDSSFTNPQRGKRCYYNRYHKPSLFRSGTV